MSGVYWKVWFYFRIYLSLKYFQTKPSVALNAYIYSTQRAIVAACFADV